MILEFFLTIIGLVLALPSAILKILNDIKNKLISVEEKYTDIENQIKDINEAPALKEEVNRLKLLKDEIYKFVLKKGEVLKEGERLKNLEDYELCMQHDGNLVLSKNGKIEWNSRTTQQNILPQTVFSLEFNGNLILWREEFGKKTKIWETHLESGGDKMILNKNVICIVKDFADGTKTLWRSCSERNGMGIYCVDGKLKRECFEIKEGYEHKGDGIILFNNQSYFELKDGCLCYYNYGMGELLRIWSSETTTGEVFRFKDGKIELKDCEGKVVWKTYCVDEGYILHLLGGSLEFLNKRMEKIWCGKNLDIVGDYGNDKRKLKNFGLVMRENSFWFKVVKNEYFILVLNGGVLKIIKNCVDGSSEELFTYDKDVVKIEFDGLNENFISTNKEGESEVVDYNEKECFDMFEFSMKNIVGRWTYESFDEKTKIWEDVVNDKDIKVEGCVKKDLEGKFVFGDNKSGFKLPSLFDKKNKYTLCVVSKYNGKYKKRIFEGVAENYLIGYHNGKSGVSHKNTWVTCYKDLVGDNWMSCVDSFEYSYVNGENLQTKKSRGNAPTQFAVNRGRYKRESSDWAIAEMILFNRILSKKEIENVNKHLKVIKDKLNLYDDNVEDEERLRKEREPKGLIKQEFVGYYRGDINYFKKARKRGKESVVWDIKDYRGRNWDNFSCGFMGFFKPKLPGIYKFRLNESHSNTLVIGDKIFHNKSDNKDIEEFDFNVKEIDKFVMKVYCGQKYLGLSFSFSFMIPGTDKWETDLKKIT